MKITPTSHFANPNRLRRRFWWLVAFMFFETRAVHAHHSFATHYKYDEQVEISGVITEFRLANPHSFMHIEVALEGGATEMWEVDKQILSCYYVVPT